MAARDGSSATVDCAVLHYNLDFRIDPDLVFSFGRRQGHELDPLYKALDIFVAQALGSELI